MPELSWAQENYLTIIDGANDSFVSLLLLQRSNVEMGKETLFSKLQHERITASLAELDALVEKNQFDTWDYPAICLFCLLDWVLFRDLDTLENCANLLAFYERNGKRSDVQSTDPR